ncbi:hypothetical protein ACG83_39875 [Frankia sp. R43]|nr:hypothetical protein ACG83_39875 [Frankia sp. R43]
MGAAVAPTVSSELVPRRSAGAAHRNGIASKPATNVQVPASLAREHADRVEHPDHRTRERRERHEQPATR